MISWIWCQKHGQQEKKLCASEDITLKRQPTEKEKIFTSLNVDKCSEYIKNYSNKMGRGCLE